MPFKILGVNFSSEVFDVWDLNHEVINKLDSLSCSFYYIVFISFFFRLIHQILFLFNL